MTGQFEGWASVAERLRTRADEEHAKTRLQADRAIDGPAGRARQKPRLNTGQQASLRALAERLPHHGALIADEVGMGKTRIAVDLARCVIEARGRVAILVPPGLGFQWQSELIEGGISAQPILRSFYGFLRPWKANGKKNAGLPGSESPWFSESAVILSHGFGNWRLGEQTGAWRVSLLPEVFAQAKRRLQGRLPNGYTNHPVLSADRVLTNAVKSAAGDIVTAHATLGSPGRRYLDELIEAFDWRELRDDASYRDNTAQRCWLERCAGLGLGAFDLIVIDEAHKNRGESSGLSRLLKDMLLYSRDVRRLGMTATPVELDVRQWRQTLSRIGLDEANARAIETAISNYAQAVSRVKLSWRSSADARAEFGRTARAFQDALGPYVVRRDKREDEMVQSFAKASGLPMSAYRHEAEIPVSLDRLAPAWRHAVCAAEALSFVAATDSDLLAKRLRLTMGSGHGIAVLLDEATAAEDDATDETNETGEAQPTPPDNGRTQPITTNLSPAEAKRAERAHYWRGIIERTFADCDQALFEHPALVAAVEAIETATTSGEKVLVFGRFIRPLRALVQLLNAREMLRCVAAGMSWPQGKVHTGSSAQADPGEWPAVRAAHRQLGSNVDLALLDLTLKEQYERHQTRLHGFRERLVTRIAGELKALHATRHADRDAQRWLRDPATVRARAIFRAFRRESAGSAADDTRSPIAVVARAIWELLREDAAAATEGAATPLFDAFRDLIQAAGDQDEGDDNRDGRLDADEAKDLWTLLVERIREEYERPQGGFARLMYGGTKQDSRRIMQLAFNRTNSFPRVLVAQSSVGREGLNLHRACRTVVLLHPEWNPGVVEQQIGRIDRVGSRWSTLLGGAIAAGAPSSALPRIEIRPVVFRGTYDEHNWRVLRRRWDELRAQLHGVVVTDMPGEDDPEGQALAEMVNAMSPTFSPSHQAVKNGSGDLCV